MKKNLTLFLLAVMTITLSLTATSCGGDDDFDANNIVGEWYVSKVKGYMMSNGSKVEMSASYTKTNSPISFVFNSDGTGTTNDNSEDEEGYPLTWSIDGKTMTIIEDGETQSFKIKKLTSSTLTFTVKATISEEESDVEAEVEQTMTLTKK